MKHIWQRLALCLALLTPAVAHAQVLGQYTISVQDSGTSCSNANTCATFQSVQLGPNPSFVIGVTGTGSGTLTFQIQADGTTWTTAQVKKLSDGTSVTTTTATGNFGLTNPGLTGIRVVGTTIASGSFSVTLTAGVSSASTTTGSGSSGVTGGTCTNQVVTAISTAGVPTCALVSFAAGGTNATAQDALTVKTVASPPGTSSTAAFVMMGLAGTITPVATGRLVITISGYATNTLITDGGFYKMAFGTGSAPSNGGAATGTVIGGTPAFTATAASAAVPFSLTYSTTGLTLGVAVWIDLQLEAITAGTASVNQVMIVAQEL